MTAEDEVERVARLSYGRLVAALAARGGGLAQASDALGDALLRALESWPRRGVPDRPEAWLLATARRRLIDAARHRQLAGRAQAHLILLDEERDAMADAATPDRRLDLMFVCAHPAIDARLRTPLMLQVVLGLDARRMAGAFLVPPATLGQRLSRAKAKIEAAGLRFEVPPPEARPERLGHVLDAVYAAYTVGADGLATGDVKAPGLSREALWLARLLARLLPAEPEAQALLALLLHAEARRPARLDAAGRFVPLEEQDPTLWDAALIEEGDLALEAARRRLSLGPYQLEAAIQAAHSARRHGGRTDWAAVALLYRGLVALHPGAGALTGLAAALGESEGPEPGLAALDRVDPVRRQGYQPWWAVRAHLLRAMGDREGAIEAYGRAIALSEDPAARAFLAGRRAALLSA